MLHSSTSTQRIGCCSVEHQRVRFFVPRCIYIISFYSSSNSRSMATNPPPPSERASEIIEKLPSSPSLITKTGTALLGTGLIATAVSQELYVVNEESIILLASLIVFTYLGKVIWTCFNICISLTCFCLYRCCVNLIVNGPRVISTESERSSMMHVLSIPVLWKSALSQWVRWKMWSPLPKPSSLCQR